MICRSDNTTLLEPTYIIKPLCLKVIYLVKRDVYLELAIIKGFFLPNVSCFTCHVTYSMKQEVVPV